jgi:ribonuclease BN (tRNA processing enzyme)
MTTLKRRTFLNHLLGAGVISQLPLANSVLAQNDNTMKLILLGTQGGPNFNLMRGETSSLIMVGDRPYLIDCGYGTFRALLEADVNFLSLPNIFLTHLHDDHVADLPVLLSHQWTQGRVEPTMVYGPYGTEALVASALQFNQANTDIRFIDEQRTLHPSTVTSGEVIPATTTVHKAYEDDRVLVTTIENTHFPEWAKEQMPHRALSYRFDTDDRSIVFSGDTTYSENLVKLAQGADIFVCETIELVTTREWFDQVTGGGGLYQDAREGIWQHIIETHASTQQAGRMAAEAGVTTLVLNHVLPGSLMDLPDEIYFEGIRESFQGEIIVGTDQMVI